ncbi:hypothetical protein PILCRDRAFT_92344 [Piloderma croceum F 1598]|uniref:SNF2 N-terminal domain-containing protein n=1 Tax=Piloderma croceum (strain F 1598) TaxID=765440 RepID=A0A0C3F4Q1_PILCF|nr:hypothetical protein PILCRDRAFT_92344 [Piloderma croceum F 1598]
MWEGPWVKSNQPMYQCIVVTAHLLTGYWAILSLLDNAKIVIGATATPLFNGFQDLTNLGHLLRIPAFQGEKGDQLDKDLKSKVKKAERMLTPAEKAQAQNLVSQVQQGLGKDEVDKHLTDAQESVQLAMMTAIGKVRKHWGRHIIRCTNDSVKDNGTPINSEMPECQQIYAYVELEESEHVTELVGDCRDGDIDINFNSETFYMDYWILTAFVFGSPEKKFPIFEDLDQYNRTDTSKLKCLVNLVKHLLIDDRIKVPKYKEDGSVHYPDPLPLATSEDRPQKHKIVVHQDNLWLPIQRPDPL